MLTAKTSEIVDTFAVIQKIGDLPALKLSWRIGKIARRLQPIYEQFRTDELALYKTYGKEKVAGGGNWEVLPGNFTEFDGERKILLDKKVEVDIEPIPLGLFDFAPDPKYPDAKYQVPPLMFSVMGWIIEETVSN